jgi:ABC-2 type transport system permease protein
MVYDRETGAMRTLLVSPYPRWFLLGSKLVASVLVSVLQVYAFLVIAWFWGVEAPRLGYVTVLPALVLAGIMLGSLGLLISSAIRQLENFAGVMNFVIFPMFFASTALYPLWRMRDSSVLLHDICAMNPFTHAVELIRFALYAQFNPFAFAVVVGCTIVFFGATIFMYDPAKGLWRGRRGGNPWSVPCSSPFWPRRRPSPPGRPIPTGPASSGGSRTSRSPRSGAGRCRTRRRSISRSRRRCRRWPR